MSSNSTPPYPTPGSWHAWALQLTEYLLTKADNRGELIPSPIQLSHLIGDERVIQDGVLMYDPVLEFIVYSRNGVWVSLPDGPSVLGTGVSMRYHWTTITSGQVPSGRYGITDPIGNATNTVRVSSITRNGVDVLEFWSIVHTGDYTLFIEETNNAESVVYKVTGPAVVVGGSPNWIEIPVELIAAVGESENGRRGVASIIQDPANRLPAGGSTNQYLRKLSNYDYDAGWGTLIEADITDFDRVRWRGAWMLGNTYQINDWAKQGAWSAVATAITTDQLEPQPLGAARYLIPDVPSWVTNSTPGSNLSGLRIAPVAGSLFKVTAVRFDVLSVSADYKYEVWTVDEADPSNPVFTRQLSTDGSALVLGWNVASIDPVFVTEISRIAVLLRITNTATSTTITGQWRRGANSHGSAPAIGEWNRDNQNAILRVSKTDFNVADRTADLLSLVSGANIELFTTGASDSSITYGVLSDPVDQGSYIEYEVTVIELGILGEPVVSDITTLTSTVAVVSATDYRSLLNGTLDITGVSGILSTSGEYGNLVGSGDAYGIALLTQAYTISPDWDLLPNN